MRRFISDFVKTSKPPSEKKPKKSATTGKPKPPGPGDGPAKLTEPAKPPGSRVSTKADEPGKPPAVTPPTSKAAPTPNQPQTETPPAAQPQPPKATATPRGGNEMTRPTGAHYEGKSLYGFGEGLKQVPTTIDEFATQLDALANAADGEQPLDPSLTERIRQAAATVRGVARDSDEWHGHFRRQHEADIHRVEEPRKGSTHIEQRADVQSARNDI